MTASRTPPFDHPSTLIDYLVAHGFRSGTEGVSLPPSTYGHVLWLQEEPAFQFSAQITAARSHLGLGFGGCYRAQDGEAVGQRLNALVAGLFEASGLEPPPSLLEDMFAARGERALIRGGLSVDVVFPDPEPDQDFENIAIGVSRSLRPGEWEAWVEAGLFSAAETARHAAEEAGRATLRRRGHPLADASLTHVIGTNLGDERMDMFTTDTGSSIQVLTRGDDHAVMIIGVDGTLEEVR